MMDINNNIKVMQQHADVIAKFYEGVSGEQGRWKPDPESWSLLEVIHHLFDEEREDFRVRIEHTLENRSEPWPGIDPGGWVTSRNYNQKNLAEILKAFLKERKQSIKWLKSLSKPDWNTKFEAPFGMITAGDLLAAWVAHDLLHLRQIVELQWAWTMRELEPYSVQYAGEW